MGYDPPRHCDPAAYQLFAAQMEQIDCSTQALRNAAVALSMHELGPIDLEAVEQRLTDLADNIRRRTHSDHPTARLTYLHQVLFEEEGFSGNAQHYYDPHNSYLPTVLRTRLGIPVSLALVYKEVAERVDLEVCGINAPGHFLVRVELDGSPMLIDPFYQGRVLTCDEAFEQIEQMLGSGIPRQRELLAECPHRRWLSRMLRNLQAIFARVGRNQDMYAMRELHQLLGPDAW
jgi:regulator of sirC expression with transglutaminase-like and TPR domain